MRRFRNDQGIKTSQRVCAKFELVKELLDYESALRFVLRLDEPSEAFVLSGSVEVSTGKISLDLRGTVDFVAERARLAKDLVTAKKDHETALVKINNQNFMAKAPASVVLEIKERLATTNADIARISSQLQQLADK